MNVFKLEVCENRQGVPQSFLLGHESKTVSDFDEDVLKYKPFEFRGVDDVLKFFIDLHYVLVDDKALATVRYALDTGECSLYKKSRKLTVEEILCGGKCGCKKGHRWNV